MRYGEVIVWEIVLLLRRNGHEARIEGRLGGVRVKERLADVVKGRLGDCVVLLLEPESDNVARFGPH